MYKKDFPYFKNSNVVYLDNAATTQKPQAVIDSQVEYYEHYCANTHRSNFGDANKATQKYENARKHLRSFINASKNEEIIFTKGVTESINFIAHSFANSFDTVIISSLEHHSNIVPWHMQGRTLHKGLEVVKYTSDLDFDFENFEALLQKYPKAFVSVTHISNAFGKINDLKAIIKLAHKYEAVVLVDGAQSLAHMAIDVQALDVDFLALSAHKSFAPTGVGAVYVKEEHLNKLLPYQTGGATIDKVDFESSTLLDSPYKFEAGTQNIAGVIGFSQALSYIESVGYKQIQAYEEELYAYLDEQLHTIEEIKFYNSIQHAIGSRSFNIKGIVHDDIGILLDKMHIAVRVGHHCAQPIMKALGIKGTIRVSIAFYNDKEDIDQFITALKKAIAMLKG
ncbi:aminotransferase class V-fold PLP-dependent enzyme [Candidatus Marinarcus aquaticus]|uniref:Probable cysteine desulfurase n=1 Tax=Candidatus Marinarcus aquaticus TaxID=2044504 RepID=A0A4Q0XMS2_9BACT|nr:cysteine desulfurase [Candidatus Marinarcus aquaticus]RXJ55276.1 selenocysteine lyase [Candidatus Marinarcus aquaticus]